MLFFRSYFFKGSETDLNKLVQKQLALNSTITTLERLAGEHRVPTGRTNLFIYKKDIVVIEYGWKRRDIIDSCGTWIKK